MYAEVVEKLEGNATKAIWIGALCFGTGFASLAVFGPTM